RESRHGAPSLRRVGAKSKMAPDMARFTGKVVLITGGAGGIGRAAAVRFATEGARVVVVDVAATNLKQSVAAVEKVDAEVLAVEADVTRLGGGGKDGGAPGDAAGGRREVCRGRGEAVRRRRCLLQQRRSSGRAEAAGRLSRRDVRPRDRRQRQGGLARDEGGGAPAARARRRGHREHGIDRGT